MGNSIDLTSALVPKDQSDIDLSAALVPKPKAQTAWQADPYAATLKGAESFLKKPLGSYFVGGKTMSDITQEVLPKNTEGGLKGEAIDTAKIAAGFGDFLQSPEGIANAVLAIASGGASLPYQGALYASAMGSELPEKAKRAWSNPTPENIQDFLMTAGMASAAGAGTRAKAPTFKEGIEIGKQNIKPIIENVDKGLSKVIPAVPSPRGAFAGRMAEKPVGSTYTRGEVADAAAQHGVNLTLGEATEHPIAVAVEKGGRHTVLGSGVYEANKKANAVALQQWANDEAAKYHPEEQVRETLGPAIKDKLNENIQVEKHRAQGIYQELDAQGVQTKPVNVEEIQNEAARILEKEGPYYEAHPQFKPTAAWTVIEDLATSPATSWEYLHKLRSDLLDFNRNNPDIVKGRAEGWIARMSSVVDRALTEEPSGLTPEQVAKFREASSIWKNIKQTYDNPKSPFYQIVRTPDLRASTIPNSLLNQPTEVVRLALDTLGDLRGPLQRQFVQTVLEGKNGELDLNGLDARLNRIPNRRLVSILGEQGARDLRMLGKVAGKVTFDVNPSGSAKTVIPFAEGGALIANPIAGGAEIVGQYGLAKGMTSKGVREFLTKENKPPAKGGALPPVPGAPAAPAAPVVSPETISNLEREGKAQLDSLGPRENLISGTEGSLKPEALEAAAKIGAAKVASGINKLADFAQFLSKNFPHLAPYAKQIFKESNKLLEEGGTYRFSPTSSRSLLNRMAYARDANGQPLYPKVDAKNITPAGASGWLLPDGTFHDFGADTGGVPADHHFNSYRFFNASERGVLKSAVDSGNLQAPVDLFMQRTGAARVNMRGRDMFVQFDPDSPITPDQQAFIAKAAYGKANNLIVESGGHTKVFSDAITPRGVADTINSVVHENNLARAQQLLDLHKKYGGSTFNWRTGSQAGKDGYAVSMGPANSSYVRGRDLTAEDVAAFYEKNKDALSRSDRAIGTWNDKEAGVHELNVTHVVPNEQQALARAFRTGEESIFDLKNLKEIKVEAAVPTVKEFVSMIRSGIKTANWYHRWPLLQEMFGNDYHRFTKVTAALSPMTDVARNATDAFNVYADLKQWQNDHPGQTITPLEVREILVKNRVAEVVPGQETSQKIAYPSTKYLNVHRAWTDAPISGPKVNPFYRNLLGDEWAVTIDTWMYKAGLTPLTPKKGAFANATSNARQISNRVMRAALKEGLEPRQAQAAVWGFTKTLWEMTENGKMPMSKAALEVQGHIAEASRDFVDLILHDPEVQDAARRAGITEGDISRLKSATEEFRPPTLPEQAPTPSVLQRIGRKAQAYRQQYEPTEVEAKPNLPDVPSMGAP